MLRFGQSTENITKQQLITAMKRGHLKIPFDRMVEKWGDVDTSDLQEAIAELGTVRAYLDMMIENWASDCLDRGEILS